MNEDPIYRDSVSAWRALASVAGLDMVDRDADLALQLKERIDPDAQSLDEALRRTPTAQFVTALFAVVQPFTAMMSDVLRFFEAAGAREGQGNLRMAIGETVDDLKHFEEFLEHWTSLKIDLDVPALDLSGAFTLNNVRLDFLRAEGDDYAYLRTGETHARGEPYAVGDPDIDAWFAAYEQGRYEQLPSSLWPETQPPGLDDTARVVMAALHVLRDRGLTRAEVLAEHRARRYRVDRTDALHPWSIAQSETDYWLRSEVLYLVNLRREPESRRREVGERVSHKYAKFGRRQFCTTLDVRSLERLLSLPAWKRRYELFGVWVATQIVDALHGHQISIHHDQGVMRFAFRETLLADVLTSTPPKALYTERRVPLTNPRGKSRERAAQPDFSMWTTLPSHEQSVLVVEVKHYKKESTGNFGNALADYAAAHPWARVVLVNYGPAKGDYSTLVGADAARCFVLGGLTPTNVAAKAEFYKLVRDVVGEPSSVGSGPMTSRGTIAVDVSSSMERVLDSEGFWDFVLGSQQHSADFVLVDTEVRATLKQHELRAWFASARLQGSTAMSQTIGQLLLAGDALALITDMDGAQSLIGEVPPYDQSPLPGSAGLLLRWPAQGAAAANAI